MPTKIEWCTEVWNPVTGCTKVSAGCANCYAERMVRRFGSKLHPALIEAKYDGNEIVQERRFAQFGDVLIHNDRRDRPFYWRKPRRIFVCSMGDLFHSDVPDSFILDVFTVMRYSPQHVFMVLTKRPQRMHDFMYLASAIGGSPNIWLGVSIEDQKTADKRIQLLLQTPAEHRFLSYEPALGEVDLIDYLPDTHDGHVDPRGGPWLEWVIMGCESGPNARPMDPSWARLVRDQCAEVSVPFFFKQAKVAGKMVKMPKIDGSTYGQVPVAAMLPNETKY